MNRLLNSLYKGMEVECPECKEVSKFEEVSQHRCKEKDREIIQKLQEENLKLQ